jgi:hypothetical protein
MKINKVFNNKDKDESGIGSSLIRPLYNDKEVEKAVDVRVGELIPQPPSINRELVTLADYNQALDEIDSLLTQLELVSNTNTELTSEVSRLQGEVVSLRAELEGVKNTNTGLQSSLSAIQSQLQTAMSDLTAARTAANTADSQAFMAQAEKLVAQGRADSLQQTINSLNTQIASLQAALANAERPVNVAGGTGGGGGTSPPPTQAPPPSGGGGGGGTTPTTTQSGGGSTTSTTTQGPIIPFTPTGDIPDISQIEQWLNDPNYIVILAYSNVAANYGIGGGGMSQFNQFMNTPHIIIDNESLPMTQIEINRPNLYPGGGEFLTNHMIGVFDLGGYSEFSNRFGSLYPHKSGTNYTSYYTTFPVTTWGTAVVFKKPNASELSKYVKNISNGNLQLKLRLRTKINKTEYDSIISNFISSAETTPNSFALGYSSIITPLKPYKSSDGIDKSLTYFESDDSIYSLSAFGINAIGIFDNNIFYDLDEENIKSRNNRDLTSYELKDPRRYNILAEWNEWTDGNGNIISQNLNSEITISSSKVMMLKAKFVPYDHIEFNYGTEDEYSISPAAGAAGLVYSNKYDWYSVVAKRRFLENIGKLELIQYPDSYGQYVTQMTSNMASQTNPSTGQSATPPSVWMYPGSFTNTTGLPGQGGSGYFLPDTNQDSFSPKITIFDVSTQSQLNTATNSTLKGLVPTGESSAQLRHVSYHIGDKSFETELHIGETKNPKFNTVVNFQQVRVDENSGYVKIYPSSGALLNFTKSNTTMSSYMQFQSESGHVINFDSNFRLPVGPPNLNSSYGYPIPKKSKYTLKFKNENTNPSFTFNASSNSVSTNAFLWDKTDSGLNSIINSAKIFNLQDSINLSWDIPWWKYRQFVIYDFGDVSGILDANSLMIYGNVSVVDAQTGNTIPPSQSNFLQNSIIKNILNNSIEMFRLVEFRFDDEYSAWNQKYNNITNSAPYYSGNVIEWKQYLPKAPDEQTNAKQLWSNYTWDTDIYKIFDSKSTNTSYKINFSGDLNNLYSNTYRFIVLVGNGQKLGLPYSYNPDVYIIPIKWNTDI